MSYDVGENKGVQPDPLRATLGANLKRLIAYSGKSVRAWALARELDVKMIDRLTKGEHAVTLDKLGQIAAACGLKPWQLLLEDFDPTSPPDAPITDEERRMLQRLRKLLDSTD